MTDQGALGKKSRVETFRSVALGIVVAVSSANIVWMSVGTPPAPIDTTGFPSNPIARHELQYSAVRAAVVARGISGTLGYIGEQPRGRWLADSKTVEDYYLAQFALAPLILDADAGGHEWIVADLARDQLAARAPSGWNVVEDFGDGTLLLRKGSP